MSPDLQRFAERTAAGQFPDLEDRLVIQALRQLCGSSLQARPAATAALQEVLDSFAVPQPVLRRRAEFMGR